jgi:hypothetical protein
VIEFEEKEEKEFEGLKKDLYGRNYVHINDYSSSFHIQIPLLNLPKTSRCFFIVTTSPPSPSQAFSSPVTVSKHSKTFQNSFIAHIRSHSISKVIKIEAAAILITLPLPNHAGTENDLLVRMCWRRKEVNRIKTETIFCDFAGDLSKCSCGFVEVKVCV